MTQFLTNQNLILKTDKFIGVNYVGDIIAGIYEFGFERSLRNDHTGVADDVGAVPWLGNLKKDLSKFSVLSTSNFNELVMWQSNRRQKY